MIPRLLLIICVLTAPAFIRAEDEQFPVLRAGSEVYTNVTVTSITATHIYFMHSGGIGDAKLRDLDPALQKQFHYNSTNAAAAALQRAQANAQYRQALEAKPASAVVALPPAAPAATAAPQRSEADNIIPPHKIYAKSFLNQDAPELKVEKWLTPEPEPHGKFILVDFWATWCGPCRRAIPDLNTLSGIFKDKLVVIGLSSETEQAVLKMKNPPIAYSVAIDTEQRTSSVLQITGIPHALLIDPKGIVRFEGMPHYLDQQNLAALIAKYSE